MSDLITMAQNKLAVYGDEPRLLDGPARRRYIDARTEEIRAAAVYLRLAASAAPRASEERAMDAAARRSTATHRMWMHSTDDGTPAQREYAVMMADAEAELLAAA